jgi:hemerythrin-like domain-containing protein
MSRSWTGGHEWNPDRGAATEGDSVLRSKSDVQIESEASRMPTSPDAIALLKADHKKVKALLASLEKTTERSSELRVKLLSQIESEMKVHATVEEELFYPAYRDAVRKKDDKELYQEALEEHHVVDLLMPEIKNCDPASEVFAAKATVLKEIIEHHAEEEEKEMFKKARQAMSAAELREIGARMQARKKQLKAMGSPRLGQATGASRGPSATA